MPITAIEPGISCRDIRVGCSDYISRESLIRPHRFSAQSGSAAIHTLTHQDKSTRLHLDVGPQRAQRKAALPHCLHCEDMSLEMHRTSRSGRRARSAKRPFCRRAKAGSWVQLEATLLLAMRASSHDFTPAAVTASTSAPVSNPSLPAALSACMRTP